MDFNFEFKRRKTSKIPREKILAELENFARINNFTDFKQDDFNAQAPISSYTVYREFGSWENALQALAEHLKNKGIDFKITSRRSTYTTNELFDEMERIWRQLGHRPSENEWNSLDYKISYNTYCRHFGGWQKACLKFIEYKSGKNLTEDEQGEIATDKKIIQGHKKKKYPSSSTSFSRTIPLSVRVKVLARDNFKCVFCGKSPATDIGTKLHIDHIVPFSNGGASTFENLQTLCEECNLGKSNENIYKLK